MGPLENDEPILSQDMPDNTFEVEVLPEDALTECEAGTPGRDCAPALFSVSTRESYKWPASRSTASRTSR